MKLSHSHFFACTELLKQFLFFSQHHALQLRDLSIHLASALENQSILTYRLKQLMNTAQICRLETCCHGEIQACTMPSMLHFQLIVRSCEFKIFRILLQINTVPMFTYIYIDIIFIFVYKYIL